MTPEQQHREAAAGRCPICKKPTQAAYRPFCSARCRDVDLSRWLRGAYAIPGGESAPGKGTATEQGSAADEEESGED